jgi:hypothetical protein
MAATPTRGPAPGFSAPSPSPHRRWLERWVRSVPGSAQGIAEALRAASADVAGAIDPRPHPAVDPLSLRDPE